MAKARTPATEAKPKPRKPRQAMIPGTEPERIEEIEIAADAFADAKDAQKKSKTDADSAAEMLIALMNKHHKKLYASDRFIVHLKGTTKAAVKKVPEKTSPELSSNGEAE